MAAKKEVRRPPVRLKQPGNAGGGVRVEITTIRAITAAKAQLPGEVAGPAIAVTVSVRNGARQPLDLSAVVVTLTDAAEAPATEMTAAPARPLQGRLARGAATSGTYVFAVETNRRNPVRVTVTLAGESPVLVFEGDGR